MRRPPPSNDSFRPPRASCSPPAAATTTRPRPTPPRIPTRPRTPPPVRAADGTDTGGGQSDCAAGKTVNDGVLTIATGEPAFPPYVINDAPKTVRVSKPPSPWPSPASWASRTTRSPGSARRSTTRSSPAEELRLQPPAVHDQRRAAVASTSVPATTAHRRRSSASPTPRLRAPRRSTTSRASRSASAGTTSVAYVEDVIPPNHDVVDLQRQRRAKQALEATRSTRCSTSPPRCTSRPSRSRAATWSARSKAAAPTSSVCCSPRTARSPPASTSRSGDSRLRRARRDPQEWMTNMTDARSSTSADANACRSSRRLRAGAAAPRDRHRDDEHHHRRRGGRRARSARARLGQGRARLSSTATCSSRRSPTAQGVLARREDLPVAAPLILVWGMALALARSVRIPVLFPLASPSSTSTCSGASR